MYDPRTLANFILDLADARGFAITNMALNKILFFAHGWSIGERDKPLVSATFEAWQFGPVLPIIYRQFSKCGRTAINTRATRVEIETGRDVVMDSTLAPDDAAYLTRITEMLAPVSALVLSDMSHERGGPWDQVYNSTQRVNPGMVISQNLIETHFKGKSPPRKNGHVH